MNLDEILQEIHAMRQDFWYLNASMAYPLKFSLKRIRMVRSLLIRLGFWIGPSGQELTRFYKEDYFSINSTHTGLSKMQPLAI